MTFLLQHRRSEETGDSFWRQTLADVALAGRFCWRSADEATGRRRNEFLLDRCIRENMPTKSQVFGKFDTHGKGCRSM
jgi:hypothetical protein